MTLHAALVLADAAGSAAAHINRRLSRIGLDMDDVRRFTAVAAASDGATLKAISTDMHETPTQCLRALRESEKLGWVQRDDAGRFTLTDSGADILDQAHGIGDFGATEWFGERDIRAQDVIKLLTR